MDLFSLFGKGSKSSKNIAKERLKLVLVHDRTNCSDKFLENIKGDLIKTISNYIEIDEDGFEVKMTKSRDSIEGTVLSALVANIPIKKVKDSIR